MVHFIRERIPIGILTVGDAAKGFRGNRNRFKEWATVGYHRGFDVYVIPHDGIQIPHSTVHAFQYEPLEGRWTERLIERPLVIYNRIPNRDDERSLEVKKVLTSLARVRGLSLFNRQFFNKWTLISWLIRHPGIRKHVPRTQRFKENASFLKWMKRYKTIYFKPVDGMAGAGIIVCKFEEDHKLKYGIAQQTAGHSLGVKVSRYRSGERWRSELIQAIGANPYIMQQGVTLLRHQGRPFDLRVLIQKNRHGRWGVTGIGARVAGATSITTHVPRGGSIAEPAALLREAFGRAKTKALLRKLRRLAPRVARQIERASGDELGELSLDVGVDIAGKLWLFEANAKPMSFDEPLIHARALRHFFDYCRFLHNRNKQRLQR